MSPGPSESWPAVVARRYGWPLLNLGFSSEAHLDPVVARTIRGLPADLVSLCLGINVYLMNSFGPRTLVPAVCGFIETIRDGHPDIPLVVITPLVAPDHEHRANAVGLTLEQVRDQVAAAAEVLRRLGDRNLHMLPGPALLGPADAHLLRDGVHPGAAGDRLIAERIGPRLAGLLPSVR